MRALVASITNDTKPLHFEGVIEMANFLWSTTQVSIATDHSMVTNCFEKYLGNHLKQINSNSFFGRRKDKLQKDLAHFCSSEFLSDLIALYESKQGDRFHLWRKLPANKQ